MKGYCDGDQQKCSSDLCPIYGSLRKYSDGVLRATKCPQKPSNLSKNNNFLKKTPLKHMSKKRKSQLPQRKEVRRIVLTRDMLSCRAKFLVPSIECHGPLDVDEIVPRGRGGDWLDIENCQVLCRAHHTWKHDNPADAERLGLTKSLPPQ